MPRKRRPPISKRTLARNRAKTLRSKLGHSLVLVVWRDSTSTTKRWHDESVLDDFDPAVCRSVGWLGKVTPEKIVLYASEAPHEVGDVTCIPTDNMIEMLRLQ